MAEFTIIGKPIAMVDAAGKTTGAGKYTDDLSLPGMLIGKILHSPCPHARIKRIDTRRAKALDGVVAVVTGADAPKTYGILPVGHDETALAVDKVRYVGDNVACVTAVDEATAENALELIDVEYEVLPAYFDPEESMKRSEEHTSELQSHSDLVCRLLLEKKKKNTTHTTMEKRQKQQSTRHTIHIRGLE